MKKCSRCKGLKQENEYYRGKNYADGLTPHCKACHKRAYPDRPWNRTRKGKKSARKAAKAWYYRNQEKVRCYVQLRNALIRGDIKKPAGCKNCKKMKRLDAHHHDYSKPLDVIWLCRDCHKGVHAAMRISI